MVPRTRRSLLQCCAGAVALAAGCTDLRDAPDDNDEPDGPRAFRDVELVDGVEERTFRFDVDPRERGRPSVIEPREDADPAVRMPYLVSEANVDALEVDGEPIDGDLLAALREIDYEESTALVFENRVSACHRYALQYVEERDGGGFQVQFCRTKRDPDVACSVDDEHVQVTVLVVPIAYEQPPSGSGRGRRSRCQLPPGHPAADRASDDGGGERS